MRVRLGIIGGSGLYQFLTKATEKSVKTPYGKPSDKISIGNIGGKGVAFLPRHGKKHFIPPHNINHKANIFALKSIGVENIVSVASVGMINANINKGDFIILDDFLDFTKKIYTFYDTFKNKPNHVDMTNPFSPKLRKILIEICKEKNYDFIDNGIYVNTFGPRLETKAEIRMFNNLGADVVGMTVAPEAALSKELRLEYACLAVGINYACGIEEGPIEIGKSREIIKKKLPQLREIIKEVVKRI